MHDGADRSVAVADPARRGRIAGAGVLAYALVGVAIATLMLVMFALARLLGLPILGEESARLGDAGVGAAVASVALLTVDVVVPVPSSALMILNGSLFGAFGGALLSFAGCQAAALLGFAIGRRGGAAIERYTTPAARERAARMVSERGALAVLLTRPVPIVAETVAVLAGAAGMPLGRFAVAAAAGSAVPAVAYALAGAAVLHVEAAYAVLAGVLAVAAAFWLAERRWRR